MQPDKLDDLSVSIMQVITRLVLKVSPADVVRAQNQVRRTDLCSIRYSLLIFFLSHRKDPPFSFLLLFYWFSTSLDWMIVLRPLLGFAAEIFLSS